MLAFLKTLSRPVKQAILMSLDVLLVPISLSVSLAVAAGRVPSLGVIQQEWLAFVVLTVAAGFLSILLGLPRVQLKSYELSALGLSAALGAVLAGILAALIMLGHSRVPVGTPVILALMYSVFSAASRMILLQILIAIYRHDTPSKRVLIYGAGMTGIQLAMALKAHAEVRVIGFLDDNPSLQGMTVAGLTVFPGRRIESLIKSHQIERVLLAMPSLSMPRQAQIARRVGKQGVEVHALPSFAQLIGEQQIVTKLAPVLPNSVLGRQHLNDALNGGCGAYAGRVVLISGAGGSIGSELCRQILGCKPRALVLLDLNEYALFMIDRELRALAEDTPITIVPILGSTTDARLVRSVIQDQQVQVILHAAAYKHVPMVERNPIAGVTNNVFGTLTLAQAALDLGVERFVLISSDKAVRPIGVMGATKRLSEIIVGDLARRSGGTIFAMARFGNVLGSSGSVVPIFHEQISRGGPVTVTHELVTRYFMTTQEACRLVLWAGTLAEGGEIFVLDMGKPMRILHLARQVIERSGHTVRDAQNPEGDIEIVTTGLRPGEKLHEELSISAQLERTQHPKLSRTREKVLSEFETARALQALRAAIDAGDAKALVEETLRWVKRDIDHNTVTSEEAGG
ncbi:MAG: polysaccharide biosynthesis protein [Rhodobacter sp.]|nr:polysaccharide biosynthesis protein [Paracoccaceae bacterium]MCC0081302.1 polysaccharide biosynthesis protein [Rhodobacter sp.]